MANNQITKGDCPPQEDPENPDFVCFKCCSNQHEMCEDCWERYIATHPSENSEPEPEPPILAVSPNVVNMPTRRCSICDNNEIPQPSASVSNNQSVATLVSIARTAVNKYEYYFKYKDNANIPTASITPTMATNESEDQDKENVKYEENKQNTPTNTSEESSDTPIVDFSSTSNEEDPHVTSDEEQQHDSNKEEVVECEW